MKIPLGVLDCSDIREILDHNESNKNGFIKSNLRALHVSIKFLADYANERWINVSDLHFKKQIGEYAKEICPILKPYKYIHLTRKRLPTKSNGRAGNWIAKYALEK